MRYNVMTCPALIDLKNGESPGKVNLVLHVKDYVPENSIYRSTGGLNQKRTSATSRERIDSGSWWRPNPETFHPIYSENSFGLSWLKKNRYLLHEHFDKIVISLQLYRNGSIESKNSCLGRTMQFVEMQFKLTLKALILLHPKFTVLFDSHPVSPDSQSIVMVQ